MVASLPVCLVVTWALLQSEGTTRGRKKGTNKEQISKAKIKISSDGSGSGSSNHNTLGVCVCVTIRGGLCKVNEIAAGGVSQWSGAQWDTRHTSQRAAG